MSNATTKGKNQLASCKIESETEGKNGAFVQEIDSREQKYHRLLWAQQRKLKRGKFNQAVLNETAISDTDLAEIQSHLFDVLEKQRLDIAQLLHDGPVQDLYAIDYLLHGFLSEPHQGDVNEVFNTVQTTLHHVIDILQSTVWELRPTSLVPFGLRAAILSYLYKFSEIHPDIRISIHLDDDSDDIPQLTRLGLFRIFQQVFQNLEQHAQATYVLITLRIFHLGVCLTIQDNGIGFEKPETLTAWVREGHMGLAMATLLARQMNGDLVIKAMPGHGTQIQVQVPITSLKN
jgi:signal transduction histidine kinase